eukprot:COSAG02_NODE_9051_length_2349_cov_1.213333_2_plen_436_part_00
MGCQSTSSGREYLACVLSATCMASIVPFADSRIGTIIRPMVWLRHGMLRRNAATVVTFDDGDGVVRELHSRHGDLLETEIIPLQLGPRTAQLTIRATYQRSLVPGAGTYLWDYSLVYTDEHGGEIALARPGGNRGGTASEDESWWPELNERVNLQSTRQAPKYVDQSGVSQGKETAVEYEVRTRVGGKLGGIRARAEDLSVDGPAFMSNDSFLTDRGANLSVWRRYSDFHNLHMDLLSCFVGASAAVLKGVPGPPPKTWRPTSGSSPAFIEARRAKLEEFLRKVLTSPMVDARRNPYVLQFLGLAQPPLAATANDGDAATIQSVYRPVVVRMQQAPIKRLASAERTTSAEHRASMHRHYKSTERQSDSDTCRGSNGGSESLGALVIDEEPQPEPQVAAEKSEEVLGPVVSGDGDGSAAATSTKLFDDDTSDDDEL